MRGVRWHKMNAKDRDKDIVCEREDAGEGG